MLVRSETETRQQRYVDLLMRQVEHPAVLNGLTTWVAINTMTMSYALFKRPFTLPHVKDVKCPHCDTPMHAQNKVQTVTVLLLLAILR